MKKRINISLNVELVMLIIVSMIAAAAVFFLIQALLDQVIKVMIYTPAYYQGADQELIHDLGEYAERNDISSSDWNGIDYWVHSRDVKSMVVYKDSLETYDSSIEMTDEQFGNLQNIPSTESNYEQSTSYTVEFSDGIADVVIVGNYTNYLVHILYGLEFLIPVALFLMLIMVGVRRKVKYIQTLSEEIHIMEGGELNYPVTVKGRDELARLAGSLEELRVAFITKIDETLHLQDESQQLVTEMSHDLRTPMTPLLVYLGMLREKRYKNEEEHDNYIEKSYEKASQLKHLSDSMFAYFLLNRSNTVEMENMNIKLVFFDHMSAMSDYLNTEGFKTTTDIRMFDVSIRVNMDFISRIFDNLVSNIMKYADPEGLVSMSLYVEESKVVLHFSNEINELADYSNSTGFGVKNISKMMAQMSAGFTTTQRKNNYESTLIFDIVGYSSPESLLLPPEEEQARAEQMKAGEGAAEAEDGTENGDILSMI